ncbi:MAG: hypothetical protein EPN20_07790 [Magnetospirillum sp.]|nr:MAG: hypothetical protein EPN20_07790 [Magnetospirillum sp.]
MRRLNAILWRWGDRTSVPLDEAAWRRLRGRVVVGLLALAGGLALQTSILQSPDYIINGLYHNRRVINIQLQTMPAPQRAKLLERLCLAEGLFEQGGIDPYQIRNAPACSEASRQRPSKGN